MPLGSISETTHEAHASHRSVNLFLKQTVVFKCFLTYARTSLFLYTEQRDSHRQMRQDTVNAPDDQSRQPGYITGR